MLRHNLLIIYRNFNRSKSSFFINLIGLSTGLTCSILIYLWVYDELNFDKFHKKNSQLFQVMQNSKSGNDIITLEQTPGPLAEALVEEMPEVEYAAAVFDPSIFGKPTLSVKDKNIKTNGLYAGKYFFNIFSFDLIEGSIKHVLADKNSIVLSEELAMKLFNTTKDIIGKSVEFQHERAFLVSGIFKRVPANSSFQFDFVLSYEICNEKYPFFSVWGNSNPNTYVLLKQGMNITQFNDKIASLIERKGGGSFRTLFLRPYSDKYLYDSYENGVQVGGRIEYVRLFSLIAIFILVIACINFMILSTARASKRVKEIGLKKALGADRKSLIFQHLEESILMAFLSLSVAISFAGLLLPQFNEITGKHIVMNFNSFLILTILGITLFTGIIAGSYPALYLSGFNPVKVLEGKLHSSVGELWTRKGLVVFQFALSSILIVSVLVVYKQIEFIQTKKPGYDKDNIIYFDMEGEAAKSQDAFLSELKNIPGIVNVSSAMFSIVGKYSSTSSISWEGKNPNDEISFNTRSIDYDFIETLGIEMKEGRDFSKYFGSDNSKIIFNEAAIKVIGFNNPIGKVVNLWGENRQIIGVTKDFHFESLHKRVDPMIFILTEPPQNLMIMPKIMVKIRVGTEKETIDKIRKFYAKYNPGYVFEYRFLDEDYQAQYVAENRVAAISQYFAGLAILISCLGLFGLAAFTAEKRIKEIGIRKINGAKNFEVMTMLTKDFVKWVAIAYVIACPIAWYAVNKWLQGFAYKTEPSWWIFALSGIGALGVALLTVSWRSWRAATRNPVEALRYE